MSDDGTIDLALVESAIKPHDDFHYAKTRLLCLENTTSGQVLPLEYFPQARALCDKYQLQLHLDGARLFNAVVEQQVEVIDIVKHFDSVSICLSKGLGAPVGSVLVGSKVLIEQAKHWRKMLGGGMRQAGIIAAGGLYALQNNVKRLAEDHANAIYLSQQLSTIPQLKVRPAQTNMVFLQLPKGVDVALQAFLAQRNIIIYDGQIQRLVTHLNVGKAEVDRVTDAIREFFA
jgi:threonine aldolase